MHDDIFPSRIFMEEIWHDGMNGVSEWEVHLGQHRAQDIVLVNILLISVHTHNSTLHHAWREIGSGLRNELSLAQACHDWQLLNSLVSYGPEVMPCRSCAQMGDIQHHPLSTFFTPFPLLQLNVTFCCQSNKQLSSSSYNTYFVNIWV